MSGKTEYLTREKLRAYLKQRYDSLKSAGLCPICGKRRPAFGYVNCPECCERIREAAKQRRARYKSEGRCLRCGRQLEIGSPYLQCFSCRLKRSAVYRDEMKKVEK